MIVLGYNIQTIYLIGLIAAAILLVLYLLFGDVLEAVADIVPSSIINPVVILSFIAVFSASGYIIEAKTELSSIVIIVISLAITLVIVSFLHFFILLPISKAEQSMTFSETNLIGKTGSVIVTIPEEGIGEVLISQNHTIVGYPAKSITLQLISVQTEIIVLDIEESVLIVEPMNQLIESWEEFSDD